MNDIELLKLVIENKKIQKLTKSIGFWELISKTNPIGSGYNFDSFKKVSLFNNLRGVAYFEDKKIKAMFLIFDDLSWVSDLGQTGLLIVE